MQKRLDLSQLMLYIASTSGNEDGLNRLVWQHKPKLPGQ